LVGTGRIDRLFATLLRAPGMAEAVLPMTRYVTESSTLSPPHRLLLGLRTAWLDQSESVWAFYTARATAEGEEGVSVLPGGQPDGDHVARSLGQLADELVLTATVSDPTWSRLAESHSVAWLMDAVETVAHASFLCVLARSFGVTVASGDAGSPTMVPLKTNDRPTVRPAQLPLEAARIEPGPGEKMAVLRTFDRHPAMTAARRPRANYVNRVSPLTPHDRETLILRIGWDCRSEYEWAKHVGRVGCARDHGVNPALVAAGPTAPGVSDHDALLMRVADELHQDSMVSDPTWTAVIERYDLPAAMSIVFTATSYRSTSMSLNAYGVQLEPGDEKFPARAQ
jgi:alkylhydroperoxidase family enzyme